MAIFNELESLDPFRLNNLDTYSNLLYVKEMRVELSHLAHRVVQVDKYRVETCCVIGMYMVVSLYGPLVTFRKHKFLILGSSCS